jgi:5'-nucleotidase/UDP-sugar diphosphatase
MKTGFQAALFGTLCLLITGCPGGSAPVTLTLFHTNDIHTHFRPAKIDPFGLGGLARMSTLLTRLRAQNPVSLTIDAGDWSEGTWYYSNDLGANMLRAFSLMKFDAVALGNHDFLSGPSKVIQVIQAAKPSFPVLAANLDASAFPQAQAFRQAVQSSTILDAGGLKVGVIGLTTFEYVYTSYMAPVKILNIVESATAAAAALRPKVDVLLITSHNSIDANLELAKLVPGIDAVISGHSHRKIPKAMMVQNAGREVPVVETGEWGKFLGELKLSVSKDTKQVSLQSYELHPVSADIPEDPQIAAFIDDQDRELSQRYGMIHEEVASADSDFQREDLMESPLGNLAVRAYRSATGADIAMDEVSLTGVALASGPVSRMDMHDVMPHIYNGDTGREWTLHTWNAKGSDLYVVAEAFYTLSSLMPLSTPIGWLSIDNAKVIWDPKAVFKNRPSPTVLSASGSTPAVKSILYAGRPLDPTARYKVGMTEGLLFAIRQANDKFHLNLDLSQVQDTGIETWRALVAFAQGAKRLELQEYKVGSRVNTVSADVAIYPYSVDWDRRKLSIEVANHGTQASGPGTVSCFAGLLNDLVAYGTSEQKWTAIGSAAVGPLQPAGTTANAQEVHIDWDASRLQPGYWPLRCVVTAQGDGYALNNEAHKVFYLPARN